MKSFWTITLGTLLLMAGVIWLLIVTNVVDGVGFLSTWWPIFIIVPFGLRLFCCPGKFLSLLGLSLGIIFLMYTQHFLIEDLWHVLSIAAPIAVILVALHLLFERRKGGHHCDHRH